MRHIASSNEILWLVAKQGQRAKRKNKNKRRETWKITQSAT